MDSDDIRGWVEARMALVREQEHGPFPSVSFCTVATSDGNRSGWCATDGFWHAIAKPTIDEAIAEVEEKECIRFKAEAERLAASEIRIQQRRALLEKHISRAAGKPYAKR